MKTRLLCVMACLVVTALATHAMPLIWTVNATDPTLTSIGFPSSGLGGNFTYDADTNTISNFYFHDCIAFDCGTIMQTPCPGCSALASGGGTEFLFSNLSGGTSFNVRLDVATALTDSGGLISLIPGSGGSSGQGTFSSGSGSAYYFNVVGTNNGTFAPITTGTILVTPEPSEFALLALGLGIIGMIRKRI